MRKYIILIALLANALYGQTNIRVNYSFYELYNQGLVIPASLQINDSLSYFEIADKGLKSKNSAIEDEETGNMKITTYTAKERNRFIQKDFVANSVLSLENRNAGAVDNVLIKEPLPTMQWVLGDDEKEILGYLCKSATTEFRGREYKAWYSPAIPIPDGPWKFYGLPGLILQIQDNEHKINIEAYNIEINKKENILLSIPNPEKINAKRFNSWETYRDYIKETLTQRRKYLNSIVSQNSEISVEFNETYETMELVYNENFRIGSE